MLSKQLMVGVAAVGLIAVMAGCGSRGPVAKFDDTDNALFSDYIKINFGGFPPDTKCTAQTSRGPLVLEDLEGSLVLDKDEHMATVECESSAGRQAFLDLSEFLKGEVDSLVVFTVFKEGDKVGISTLGDRSNFK